MARCSVCVLFLAAAATYAAERPIAVQPTTQAVARLQKMEFTIQADARFDNPYDPAEIDLRLVLTSPAGKRITVPAFCYQPFESRAREHNGRMAEWLYPVGQPVWKARFAPDETGEWTCVAVLKSAASPPARFRCTESSDGGFIRVSRTDPRYLEFDSGKPFFAVGQNVAFVTDSFSKIEMIRKLGENGANSARIWACSEDWAMAIEARKSAFGRSWGWNVPFVPMPDRDAYHTGRLCIRLSGESGTALTLQPCYAVALRPGRRYRLAGKIMGDTGISFDLNGQRKVEAKKQWTPFSEEFIAGPIQWWLSGPSFRLTAKGSVFLADLSLKESDGGPELLWEADPNRPPLGVYNQVDCFMLDQIVEAAEQNGVYLQVVLLTRDHYMWKLTHEGRAYDEAIAYAKALARYAAARWGYSTHIAAWEYFNEMNPGLPTERFYAEAGAAFEQFDVNHHIRATSGWASPTKEYRHPQLETADMHYYLRPAEGELFKDEVAAVLSRTRLLEQNVKDRPLLFSEFGMTDDKWQRSPLLDRDREFVHLHNALWASALSGFASTTCHWYWDDIHKRDLYGLYRGISRFCADVPFNTAHFRKCSAKVDGNARVVGLQGESCAYLWLCDPQATWWKTAMDGVKPTEIRGVKVAITGLRRGDYLAQWWDTRKGEPVGQEKLGTPAGAIEIAAPPFTRDIAVKVVAQ